MTRMPSGTTVVERMGQTRRTGTGSGYPLWMRTLEEKYQKLHKKITENTGTARFTSCVGRSVYDSRLSQALTRYRDLGATHKHTVIRAKSSKIGAINTNTDSNDFQKENDNENWQNQYLDRNDTIHVTDSDIKNGEQSEEVGQDICEIQNTTNICVEETKLLSASENPDSIVDGNNIVLNIEEKVNSTLENLCTETADKSLQNGVTNQISFDKSKADVNQLEDDKSGTEKYSRKYLKTSVSRTSKATSKSCPAKIQGQLTKYAPRQLLSARSKSANRSGKMFTPMSEEAKHAITETIHEMHVSTPGRSTDRSDIKFIPSRGRTCVKSWILPKKGKNAYDAKPVLESVTQCLDNLDKARAFDQVTNDNVDSTGSTTDSQRRLESRLPDIRNGSAQARSSGRNQSYRLPGIGKYNITDEDPVFEITPPGFDSRYNDVPPVEERESETPPPDIRQRAIDKCSEWLTKYNK